MNGMENRERPQHRLAEIVENVPVARDTYRLRLAEPGIAGSIRPGQFVMIRPGRTTPRPVARPSARPLRRRPRCVRHAVTAFDVVYLVVGRGTAALSGRARASTCRSGARSATGSGRRRAATCFSSPAASARRRSWPWGGDWLGDTPAGGVFRRRPSSTASGPRRCWPAFDDFRAAGIAVEVATDDGSARPSRVRHRAADSSPGTRRAAVEGRRLRAPAMLAALARLATRHAIPLRPLARKSHGLRLRRLLQLRGADPAARRLGGLAARLR